MDSANSQNTLNIFKKFLKNLLLFDGVTKIMKRIMGDKRILECILNLGFTSLSFFFVSLLLNMKVEISVVIIIYLIRRMISFFLFDDYKLSWSKASLKTGTIKTINGFLAFSLYLPILILFKNVSFSLLLFDLAFYLLIERTSLFIYKYYRTRSSHNMKSSKKAVIYGAGTAGVDLKNELIEMKYSILFFVDDDKNLQLRSIDGVPIISQAKLIDYALCKNKGNKKIDLLVLTMHNNVRKLFGELNHLFEEIKILPSLAENLKDSAYLNQLREITIDDLLARRPKDLDRVEIDNFIKGKVIMITGAGGSIGRELSLLCAKHKAKQIILFERSEFNLYSISEELKNYNIVSVMQSVVNRKAISKTISAYKPDIIIHAAAFKHVPLVEENVEEAVYNNILGTKNLIDVAIENKVKKVILVSTDKAVNPTNVMGATKRVCELYAQNSNYAETEVLAVRFGNVLGSSGSVIPKFKKQIESGGPITVTHPEITRFFMLIPEACGLVLQASAIGRGGEIFILDMGKPIKIADLARKMLKLANRKDIKIEYTGLRVGEKLYEELLMNESDRKTQYDSITVAKRTKYNIRKLRKDIKDLLNAENKIEKLNQIVPEFNHRKYEERRNLTVARRDEDRRLINKDINFYDRRESRERRESSLRRIKVELRNYNDFTDLNSKQDDSESRKVPLNLNFENAKYYKEFVAK